jgi:hypothetical protein
MYNSSGILLRKGLMNRISQSSVHAERKELAAVNPTRNRSRACSSSQYEMIRSDRWYGLQSRQLDRPIYQSSPSVIISKPLTYLESNQGSTLFVTLSFFPWPTYCDFDTADSSRESVLPSSCCDLKVNQRALPHQLRLEVTRRATYRCACDS